MTRFPVLTLVVALALALAAPAAGRSPAKPRAAGFDARAAVKRLVADLSEYAEIRRPGFGIVVNNAETLLPRSPGDRRPDAAYLAAIDGILAESLHFKPMDEPRPDDSYKARVDGLYPARKAGKAILALDYALRPEHVATARRRAARQGYLSYCADSRSLDGIPASLPTAGRKPRDVHALDKARDFLYLVNPGRFHSENEFVQALARVPVDLLFVDAFFSGTTPLSRRAVARLKRGPDGERRLVFAYLCVGEAEHGRYYFQKAWAKRPPAWFLRENADWPGSYIVKFWDPAWRRILFGRRDAYLDRILAAGFDGVVLDTVDNYTWFENRN